jgi:hypothetical protein
MLTKSSLSTGEVMRLVVLAALNLALFQGVWLIIVIPPITMIAAILNLTLYWTWVRRRRISRPFMSSILTGIAMALAFAMYMTATNLNPTLGMTLLNWLPESAKLLIPMSLLGNSRIVVLDFALLDFLGFALMFGAGWLVAALERSRKRRSAGSVGPSS